jgi:hypothetical protein
MSLTEAIKKATGARSANQPVTRLYMKRSTTDTTKMTLLHKAGSRLFTSDVTSLPTQAATSITISELPGSNAKYSG